MSPLQRAVFAARVTPMYNPDMSPAILQLEKRCEELEWRVADLETKLRNTTTRPIRITVELIRQAVCRRFNISESHLISANRSHRLSRPRFIGMYLAREFTPLSTPIIAAGFGRQDHTTVVHGLNKVAQLIRADAEFAYLVADLEQELRELIA